MSQKKKWMAIGALLAILLLLGCWGSQKKSGEKSNLRMEFLIPRVRLTLATDQDIDTISMKGLQIFAEKMATLSSGELMVDIVTCDNPVEMYTTGKAQILFAPGELLEEVSGDFAAYSSPFYFRDYNHMTMTLNSNSFLDLVGEEYEQLLGHCMAAAYGGSSVFLSASQYISDSSDFPGLDLITDQDEDENLVLRELGADLFFVEEDKRIAGFNSGLYDTISCSAQRLSEITIKEEQRIYMADFFYDPTILWLFVSNDLYDSMDSRLRMVLTEASAYLVGTIDEERMDEINKGKEKLLQTGAEVTRVSSDELCRRSKEILKSSPAFSNRWSWERFESVQEIIR